MINHKGENMRRITQVDRILRILEMLSEGREICMDKNRLIEQMKDSPRFHNRDNDLDIGLRALQKDMVYIREYLGENLRKKGKCYKLVKKEYLDNFFKDNYKEIKKFFHAISLIDQSVFGEGFKKYKKILDDIQSEQKGVYLFLENPFENLKQLELKEQLEYYIRHKRYIYIEYETDKKYIFKEVQPYKIIYYRGNWYLAVLTTKDYDINGGFKLLRLNFITYVGFCKNKSTFHEDIHVKIFLENKFQSLFTSFDKPFFKVQIKTSPQVSRHFKVKNFLKSQNIIKELDSGALIIEFNINDDMEIIPLIQMWLPHLKIIKPKRLNRKILENISKYQEEEALI